MLLFVSTSDKKLPSLEQERMDIMHFVGLTVGSYTALQLETHVTDVWVVVYLRASRQPLFIHDDKCCTYKNETFNGFRLRNV
jgi:hypothetical protein